MSLNDGSNECAGAYQVLTADDDAANHSSRRFSPVFSAVLASALGGAIYGYATTIIGGLSDGLIQAHFFPTASSSAQSLYTGLLTACILVGGLFGCFGGMALMARRGYRVAFAVAGGICLVFSALLGLNQSFGLMILWRTLQGGSVGMCAALIPMYVTEVVPPSKQGRVGLVIQISICCSILIAEVCNWCFNKSNSLVVDNWVYQVQLAAAALPGLALLITAPFMAESKPFESGRSSRSGVAPLMSSAPLSSSEPVLSSVSLTLIEVAPVDAPSTQASTLGVADLFKREHRASLWVALVLSGADQLTGTSGGHTTWSADAERHQRNTFLTALCLSFLLLPGINAFIFYAPSIFASAGLSNVLVWIILVVGGWNLLTSLFSVGLVERFGRKTLMIVGLSTMTAACAMMTVAYAWIPSQQGPIAIAAMMLFFVRAQNTSACHPHTRAQ